MICILGGAARTGKGILSRRLLLETHLPYLSLDVLKMGIVNGLPGFGLDPDASAIEIAEKLWPLVRAMAVNMIETEVPYIIEGEILPAHANELALRFPNQIRACFLGYADISSAQKLAEIRKFSGHPNDWIASYPDAEALDLMEQNIAFSHYLREECARFGLPYFDSSENFEGALHNAATTLLADWSRHGADD